MAKGGSFFLIEDALRHISSATKGCVRMKFKSSSALLCTLSLLTLAAHAQADGFGIRGDNGNAGTSGYNGPDGQSLQVTATGQPQSLNMRGQDGTNGSNGQSGENAVRCEQPEGVRVDLWGAPGGNGGDAGAGGNGGDGGTITTYYQDIKNLRSIFVDASPGRGGIAGTAGYGGASCGCRFHHWEVPVNVCHQVTPPPAPPQPHPGPSASPQPVPPPQIVCQILPEGHDCRDGDPGNMGRSAPNGSSGQFGSAVLINNPGPLSPTQPSASVLVGTFPAQVTLTADIWATAAGAEQLFAPGSAISDTYRYWAGRKSVPVSLVWNARRPQTLFSTQEVQVTTDATGQVTNSLLTNEIWAEINTSYDSSGAAKISVDKAVLASETTQLSGQVYGYGSGTIAKLTDAANVSDLVVTDISAKVTSAGVFGHTRFEGTVPANLVTITASEVTVQIAQLGDILQNHAGDVAQGKHLKVDLTITRSLGGRSATQQISIDKQKLGQ